MKILLELDQKQFEVSNVTEELQFDDSYVLRFNISAEKETSIEMIGTALKNQLPDLSFQYTEGENTGIFAYNQYIYIRSINRSIPSNDISVVLTASDPLKKE